MNLAEKLIQRYLLEKYTPSFNLDKEYARLNRDLFHNRLPKDIPLKWISSKRKGGHVKATYYRDTKQVVFHELALSSFIKKDAEQYLPLLVHEMIHIDVMLDNPKAAAHGREFEYKRLELSRRLGVEIPVTEDMLAGTVADPTGEPLNILVVERKGVRSIVVGKKRTFDDQLDELIEFYQKYSSFPHTLTMYVTTNSEFQKYPLKRKLINTTGFRKSPVSYQISDDLLNDLEHNGKKIFVKQIIPERT